MRNRTPAAVATAVLLLGVACGNGNDEERAEFDTSDGREDAASTETAPEGPFIREVQVPLVGDGVATVELEVDAVERTDDSTALYLTYTNPGETVEEDQLGEEIWPSLIDPLTGRVYGPLVDDAANPETAGVYGSTSEGEDLPLVQGVHFEGRIYYPSLPADVETVSMYFYGMGVMTGIPVTPTDAHRPSPGWGGDYEGFEEGEPPPPGATITLPVREPDARAQELRADLLSYVDSPVGATERSGETETVALQTDVLFAFDEATLTGEASDVLAQAAGTIEAATGSGSGSGSGGTTITVVGHTDGIGEAAYNQNLSEQRAQAVRDELAGLLGEGYTFDVSGRGSSEPVAQEGGPDDEAARARNRRVEVSYTVPVAAGAGAGVGEGTGTDGATDAAGEGGLDAAERHVGEPADFRPDDGEVVATEDADGWQLDVFSLVRDGAYVIGTFELTNTGTQPATPELRSRTGGLPTQYRESSLGGFQLREPDTELTRYVALVQVHRTPGEYQDAADHFGELAPGASFRSVAIFPAPPLATDQITLLAGPFGEIQGIPIV